MLKTLLDDKLWLKLKPILLYLNIYDKPNLRNIFTGILYRLRTGCPWRYLPNCFGKHNTVFKTFRRWTKLDKFMKIFKQLIKDLDMELLSIDGTHIRAHQSSAGMGSSKAQAIAKSAGENSTKILNADRGYISQNFKNILLGKGTHSNIPNRNNSLNSNNHMDWHIYKARHVVENIFATLKYFIGLATRYDKLKSSYIISAMLL